MRICDLHVHSTYSDGTCTPSEIVAEARRRGICAIALTDHNTADGIEELLASAREQGVEAIGGVEFTTAWRSIELHILALFVRAEHRDSIARYIAPVAESKKKCNESLIESLRAAGYSISREEVEARYPEGNINRSHIARILVAHGEVPSVREAFSGILSEEAGFYIPPERLDAIETVRFIRELGAVSVIAHPYLNLNADQLEEFLCEAAEAGLDGMETRYTEYDAATTATAIETARRHGLCESGGSDYHADAKPAIALGIGWGRLCVPYELYLKLKQRAEK